MPKTRTVMVLSPLLRAARGCAWLVALAIASPARAESFGVLVRYHAGEALPSTPVVVVLTPEGGAPVTLTLQDDGAQPDVTGGDGIAAAATSVEGGVVSVTLRVDGAETALGQVSWNAAGARDLDIRRTDAGVAAIASVSSPGAGPGDAKGPAPGPAGPAGVATAADGAPGGLARPGVESTGGGPTSAPAQAVLPPERAFSPHLVFGLAGGLTLLLVLLRLWVRSGNAVPALPRGVVRLGPAGLLGPGTPSVAGTFSLWTVEADAPARETAASALLARVARDHRVLLVAPEGIALPAVAGGPVLRASSTDPDAVAAAAGVLATQPGRPLAVVATGLEPAGWAALEDALPPAVGGIGLVDPAAPPPALPPEADGDALPRVRMEPDGAGWIVTCGDARVRVRLDADGRAAALA